VTIDGNGASMNHAELLLQADPFDAKKNVVVFDNTPEKRVYLAQTGLIPHEPARKRCRTTSR
jgi:hypothetical protein